MKKKEKRDWPSCMWRQSDFSPTYAVRAEASTWRSWMSLWSGWCQYGGYRRSDRVFPGCFYSCLYWGPFWRNWTWFRSPISAAARTSSTCKSGPCENGVVQTFKTPHLLVMRMFKLTEYKSFFLTLFFSDVASLGGRRSWKHPSLCSD